MNAFFDFKGHTLRPGGKALLIAGPCVIESEAHCRLMAKEIGARVAAHVGEFIWVFKASFDKANRSAYGSPRGPGMEHGLEILAAIKADFNVPIITDIHLPEQAGPAAQVADIIQIPAFLCRQTDLLVAAAQTGRVVNIKKGQFVAPHDMDHPVEKCRQAGNSRVTVTERGTCFGYNRLVVDFAGFHAMKQMGVPVIFDATHSAQLPGGLGGKTGGRREIVPDLARAAAAVGVDGFFLEVHDQPDRAQSDAANQIDLVMLEKLLPQLAAIRRISHQA